MGNAQPNTAIILLFLGVMSIAGILGNHREEENHPIFTRDFAVELEDDGDEMIADLVASAYGFKVVKRLVNLGNVYSFQHEDVPHRSKRSAADVLKALLNDPNVKHAEQQRLLIRKKRELFSSKDDTIDPLKRDMEHNSDDEFKKRLLAELKKYEKRFPTEDKQTEEEESDKVEITEEKSTAKYNDPQFPNQWYLQDDRRSRRSLKNLDLNLGVVWDQGITGKGVVVTVLDDGLQYTHPDLKKNYDPKASTDLNDPSEDDHDPMPNTKVFGNDHGTKCAGEIAGEANNNVCGVGVAYNCQIGGIRLLDGKITDILESDAISFGIGYIDVYSASWGPSDTGKLMEAPGRYCQKALEAGITKGRNGLGAIYVWATGNGGMNDDNCNCDGYVSSIYTVSIGSVTMDGLSTYYSEVCASTLAVVYTGGPHTTSGIRQFTESPHAVVTTGVDGACTTHFVGTSGAAPLGAGCVALVLEANPKVSWRDVQHIIIESARIPNREEMVWTINGAGKHVSHEFGFGMLDCGRMVQLAQNWTNVRPQHTCQVQDRSITRVIPTKGSVDMTLVTSGCSDDSTKNIDKLEHVEAIIKLNHSYRGDVQLVLVSPSGTHSTILRYRQWDDEDNGIDFKFMSVHFWGEDPSGTWTLTVTDNPKSRRRLNTGKIFHFSLILYGTSAGSKTSSDDDDDGDAKLRKRDTAHRADRGDINNIMLKEKRTTRSVRIKRVVENPLDTKSDNTNEKTPVSTEENLPDIHQDLVAKILKSISGGILDKKSFDEGEDELTSPEKKELRQTLVDQTVQSDKHARVIQAKDKLLAVLKENGFTKVDLLNAINSLLRKIQAKIVEKTTEVHNNGDTTPSSQSLKLPGSAYLTTSKPNGVVSEKSDVITKVKSNVVVKRSTVDPDRKHSTVVPHIDTGVTFGSEGVTSDKSGSVVSVKDSSVKQTTTNPSDKDHDNQSSGISHAATKPSHDLVKEKLIRELKKMLTNLR